jgi:hypothetical protein
VLAVVVAAGIPEKAAAPAEVQTRLDQYIAHLFSPEIAAVRLAERAKKPWNFRQGMSHAVFGGGVHFQADRGRTGGLPLPFPPRELWCVVLEREDNSTDNSRSGASYAVVFVGLHMSMYEADWMVHEGDGDLSSPEFRRTLSMIGCDMGLD